MNKPSISFIIPYYKVELPLLARAITSILRLGQKADWEVWVINDGTPGHEAEDYLGSLDDPRIHYHVQPNLGLGGARNTGMEVELISCSNTIYTVVPGGMYSKSLYSTA